MRNKRNIVFILSFVLALGLLIEAIRTEYFIKLSRNTNDTMFTVNQKKVNTIDMEEIHTLNRERFLLLYDSQDENSIKIKDNAAQVLTYMKKEYAAQEIGVYDGTNKKYDSIIITFARLNRIPDINVLTDYVSNGGKLFFASFLVNDSEFYNIYRKLGIIDAGNSLDSPGIKLLSNILIKGQGYSTEQDLAMNYVLPVTLKKDSNIHAVTLSNIPLLWDVDYGQGKFMVFNGNKLSEKYFRGIIAGAISILNQDFIYPIMNMSLSYIDDFPAPIPKGYNENIFNEYSRNIPNFYREIWWPEILKGAARYGLKYNGIIIETYNDRVEPPFENPPEMDVNNLIIYGREILRNNGELGIHGYNHQSLAEKGYIKQDLGYKPWEKEDMTGSIREALRFARSGFPHYSFKSYVPPSNILSPLGREAVVAAMPDLITISSIYSEGDTDDAYIQEFEVGEDGIVELPRITDGYDNSQKTNWFILNAVSSLGIYSHFIHPDDILDPERSAGKSWEVLAKEYNDLLENVDEKYGWLRQMTASEGAFNVKRFEETKVYVSKRDNGFEIFCNDFIQEMYFILRTEKKILPQKNYKITNIDNGVYLIHAETPHFIIEFKQV